MSHKHKHHKHKLHRTVKVALIKGPKVNIKTDGKMKKVSFKTKSPSWRAKFPK